MMTEKISWEKKLPDRSFQRRFAGYTFKKNNAEIGYFHEIGFLNLKVIGKLLDNEIEFISRFSPDSKWYSTKIYTILYDNKTKTKLAKITGSLSIKYFKQPIYERKILTIEEKSYTLQIFRNNVMNVFEDGNGNIVINCKKPRLEKGELNHQEGISQTVLLAVFYILHDFMELYESS